MDTCQHCGTPVAYCSYDNTGYWYHTEDADFSVSCPDFRDTVAEPV